MKEYKTSLLGGRFRMAYFPPDFEFPNEESKGTALRLRALNAFITINFNAEETRELKLFLMENTGVPCLGRWTGCKIRLQGKCPWHEDCHMIDFMTGEGERE